LKTCFSKKELELLRRMLDRMIGGVIEGYESAWLENRIRDEDFDERYEIITKLGFGVSNRDEIGQDDEMP